MHIPWPNLCEALQRAIKTRGGSVSWHFPVVHPKGMLCVLKSGNSVRFVDKHIVDIADISSTQIGESSGCVLGACYGD